MKSVDPLDPRFVKAMAKRSAPGYSSASSKPSALADRQTRAAEEQDIYGMRSPLTIERIEDADRTLTGEYLTEEVVDALRHGSRNSELLAAARALNTPWVLDTSSLARE